MLVWNFYTFQSVGGENTLSIRAAGRLSLYVSLPRRRQRHESENGPLTWVSWPASESQRQNLHPSLAGQCCHENMFLICPRVRDWMTPEDAKIQTQMQRLRRSESATVRDAMLRDEQEWRAMEVLSFRSVRRLKPASFAVTDLSNQSFCPPFCRPSQTRELSDYTDYGLTLYLSSFKPLMAWTASDISQRYESMQCSLLETSIGTAQSIEWRSFWSQSFNQLFFNQREDPPLFPLQKRVVGSSPFTQELCHRVKDTFLPLV